MFKGDTGIKSLTPVALLLSAAALTLSGCGSTSSPTSPTATSTQSAAATDLKQFLKAPTTLPSWPKVTGTIPKDVSVYFISAGNPTAMLISTALTNASQLLGWQYHVLSYQVTNPVTLNSSILLAVNAGAKAVVFTGAHPAEIASAITAAQAHHVALVEIGGATESPQYIEIDNVVPSAAHWGKILAAAVVADAQQKHETAHVLIITSSDAADVNVINADFSSSVTAYCAACTTTTIDASDQDLFTGQASKDVVSGLQRNPNTNYVEFTLGLESVGVRAGLNGAGANSVAITGMIPSPAQLQGMKSDNSGAWVIIPNQLDGWMAADAIVRYVTGGDSSIHNNEVEPAWVVLPSSTFDASTLPELPISYPSFFGALWGM